MLISNILSAICLFSVTPLAVYASETHQKESSALQEAESHVQNFGDSLVNMLTTQAPFSEFQKLFKTSIDIPRLAQRCCPVKYDKMSSDERNSYEKCFEDNICKEYYSILKKYYDPKDNSSGSEKFKIDTGKSRTHETSSGTCCTVITDVFASNGARITVKWIVKGKKIENFVVERTDLRAAKKRDLKTRYKKSGSNIQKFLEEIHNTEEVQ